MSKIDQTFKSQITKVFKKCFSACKINFILLVWPFIWCKMRNQYALNSPAEIGAKLLHSGEGLMNENIVVNEQWANSCVSEELCLLQTMWDGNCKRQWTSADLVKSMWITLCTDKLIRRACLAGHWLSIGT